MKETTELITRKALLNLLEDLAETKNRLHEAYQELKMAQERMVRIEKLAASGRLASSAAHEMRNPLAIISTTAQKLHEELKGNAPQKKYLQTILKNMERVDRIFRELLDFTRSSKLRLGSHNINQILTGVIHYIEERCDRQRVKIMKELAPHLPKIRMDKREMERVFLNLTLNALAAMPKGGSLTLITTRIDADSDTDRHRISGTQCQYPCVSVVVSDSGCGIPKKYLDRIFDPFFTIKEQGTGLGLSISHRIIEEHKGTMDVESEVGKGTTFTIYLPTATKQTHR